VTVSVWRLQCHWRRNARRSRSARTFTSKMTQHNPAGGLAHRSIAARISLMSCHPAVGQRSVERQDSMMRWVGLLLEAAVLLRRRSTIHRRRSGREHFVR
jgi:hypothetical protein